MTAANQDYPHGHTARSKSNQTNQTFPSKMAFYKREWQKVKVLPRLCSIKILLTLKEPEYFGDLKAGGGAQYFKWPLVWPNIGVGWPP